jgi:dihydrofolate synthase/folylpolyglutamate synthase
VLEVGLGGRWDATSVVDAAVAVVTGVALDHTAILGDTREQIAAEKAGIVKPDSIAVLGPGTVGVEDVIVQRASEVAATVWALRLAADPSPVSEDLTVRYELAEESQAPGGLTVVDVHGVYASYSRLAVCGPSVQAANVATGVAAVEALLGRALDPSRSRRALAAVRVPGRFELMRAEPPIVIDAAHNPESAERLASAIRETFGERAITLLLGVLADKDAAGIVRALAPVAARIAVTRSASPRALEPAELAEIVERETGVRPEAFGSVREALEALAPDVPGGLVISGSITVAGEARALLTTR